ncbi:MAG: methionine--tRNA ligase [Spirochaetaceae bacterium]|jgi:methionyl-tRNA synthetase|nr:methionine--tRNA ligase [Spirochaetaceae bacterium]
MKRRLITSALPYVNNEPHLGNLIQVLSADCFARFCRLRGYETLYICGTDEYGTATETRAAEERVSERALCDRYWTLHDAIYRWFSILFDKFGRTSTPIHTEVTQEIFQKNDENGMISENTTEQLFCPHCGRFLADRYVRGVCPHCGYEKARGDQCEHCGKLLDPSDLKEPACSSCGSTPELRETRHLYINLPKNRAALEAWLKKASEEGRWARNAVQMSQSWIRDGLRERAITRDLKWGIPVPKPGYENKVFYVWFDAPIGYISITGNWADERGLDWRKAVDDWWKNPENVSLFQFIGKDNIPFHTVIFPSSLLGTGEKWTMLHHMSSTEYLNYESGKFSKSEGRGVFGTDVMESGIPSDVWRFYVYYNRPEKSDALFTWKDFAEKVNAELIGNLGNLVNRTLSFVTRYYGGKVPSPGGNPAFWMRVREIEGAITEALEWAELREGCHKVFELSAFANKYFQDNEPWKKRTQAPAEAEAVIGDLTALLADIAVLIQPFTPVAAEKIAGFLGLTLEKEESNSIDWNGLGQGRPITAGVTSEVLFTRLEDDFINALREKYSGSQKERGLSPVGAEDSGAHENAAAQSAQNPEDAFAALLDLRVAKIVKIERHPKADKLYIETLEIAGEERVIVSGLVPFYKEEELLGKHIVVAYNLKAAKLRGVESRGMLLAASVKSEDGSETVEALDAAEVETGTRVVLEGIEDIESVEPAPTEIGIDTFFSVPIRVADGTVMVNNRALLLNGQKIKTEKVKNGEVH